MWQLLSLAALLKGVMIVQLDVLYFQFMQMLKLDHSAFDHYEFYAITYVHWCLSEIYLASGLELCIVIHY